MKTNSPKHDFICPFSPYLHDFVLFNLSILQIGDGATLINSV